MLPFNPFINRFQPDEDEFDAFPMWEPDVDEDEEEEEEDDFLAGFPQWEPETTAEPSIQGMPTWPDQQEGDTQYIPVRETSGVLDMGVAPKMGSIPGGLPTEQMPEIPDESAWSMALHGGNLLDFKDIPNILRWGASGMYGNVLGPAAATADRGIRTADEALRQTVGGGEGGWLDRASDSVQNLYDTMGLGDVGRGDPMSGLLKEIEDRSYQASEYLGTDSDSIIGKYFLKPAAENAYAGLWTNATRPAKGAATLGGVLTSIAPFVLGATGSNLRDVEEHRSQQLMQRMMDLQKKAAKGIDVSEEYAQLQADMERGVLVDDLQTMAASSASGMAEGGLEALGTYALGGRLDPMVSKFSPFGKFVTGIGEEMGTEYAQRWLNDIFRFSEGIDEEFKPREIHEAAKDEALMAAAASVPTSLALRAQDRLANAVSSRFGDPDLADGAAPGPATPSADPGVASSQEVVMDSDVFDNFDAAMKGQANVATPPQEVKVTETTPVTEDAQVVKETKVEETATVQPVEQDTEVDFEETVTREPINRGQEIANLRATIETELTNIENADTEQEMRDATARMEQAQKDLSWVERRKAPRDVTVERSPKEGTEAAGDQAFLDTNVGERKVELEMAKQLYDEAKAQDPESDRTKDARTNYFMSKQEYNLAKMAQKRGTQGQSFAEKKAQAEIDARPPSTRTLADEGETFGVRKDPDVEGGWKVPTDIGDFKLTKGVEGEWTLETPDGDTSQHATRADAVQAVEQFEVEEGALEQGRIDREFELENEEFLEQERRDETRAAELEEAKAVPHALPDDPVLPKIGASETFDSVVEETVRQAYDQLSPHQQSELQNSVPRNKRKGATPAELKEMAIQESLTPIRQALMGFPLEEVSSRRPVTVPLLTDHVRRAFENTDPALIPEQVAAPFQRAQQKAEQGEFFDRLTEPDIDPKAQKEARRGLVHAASDLNNTVRAAQRRVKNAARGAIHPLRTYFASDSFKETAKAAQGHTKFSAKKSYKNAIEEIYKAMTGGDDGEDELDLLTADRLGIDEPTFAKIRPDLYKVRDLMDEQSKKFISAESIERSVRRREYLNHLRHIEAKRMLDESASGDLSPSQLRKLKDMKLSHDDYVAMESFVLSDDAMKEIEMSTSMEGLGLEGHLPTTPDSFKDAVYENLNRYLPRQYQAFQPGKMDFLRNKVNKHALKILHTEEGVALLNDAFDEIWDSAKYPAWKAIESNPNNADMTDEEIEAEARNLVRNQLLDYIEKDGSLSGGPTHQNLKPDVGHMKTREDVGPSVREYLGEIKDPFIAAEIGMRSMVAQIHLDNLFKAQAPEWLEAGILSKTKDDVYKYKVGGGRAGLEGYYTDKATYEQLTGDMVSSEGVVQMLDGFSSLIKSSLTSMSPKVQLGNLSGNIPATLNQGLWSDAMSGDVRKGLALVYAENVAPFRTFKGSDEVALRDAPKRQKNDLKASEHFVELENMTDEDIGAMLYEMGAIGEGTSADVVDAMRDMSESLNEEAAEAGYDSVSDWLWAQMDSPATTQAGKKKIAKALWKERVTNVVNPRFAGKAYTFGDDGMKAGVTLAHLGKVGRVQGEAGNDFQSAKQYVTDMNVLTTHQYSRMETAPGVLGQLAKQGRKYRQGKFFGFFTEMHRNAINMPLVSNWHLQMGRYYAGDLDTKPSGEIGGIKITDPFAKLGAVDPDAAAAAHKKFAFDRTTGMAAHYAVMPAVKASMATALSLAGVVPDQDEEDYEAIRRNGYGGEQPLILYKEDGKVVYLDMQRYFIDSMLAQEMRMVHNLGKDIFTKDPRLALGSAAKEGGKIAAQFLGPSFGADVAAQVIMGQDDRGNLVDVPGSQTTRGQILMDGVLQAVPGAYGDATTFPFMDAMNDPDSDLSLIGRLPSAVGDSILGITGLKPKTYDVGDRADDTLWKLNTAARKGDRSPGGFFESLVEGAYTATGQDYETELKRLLFDAQALPPTVDDLDSGFDSDDLNRMVRDVLDKDVRRLYYGHIDLDEYLDRKQRKDEYKEMLRKLREE